MSETSSDERGLPPAARALRRFALFDDLGDAALADVAALARPLALPRGAPLAEPAGALASIYLVAEGRLRLYREAPTARQVTLALLGAGDPFRFLVRAPDGGLASVAEAVGGPAALYRFPGPRLLEILAAHPAVQARFGAALARTLAHAYDALTELVLYDVETRLARVLLRLAAEGVGAGGADTGGYVGMTHEELGWRVNATRESVSRHLRRFAHLGLIATEPHRHGLVVRTGLRGYAARQAARPRGYDGP